MGIGDKWVYAGLAKEFAGRPSNSLCLFLSGSFVTNPSFYLVEWLVGKACGNWSSEGPLASDIGDILLEIVRISSTDNIMEK